MLVLFMGPVSRIFTYHKPVGSMLDQQHDKEEDKR